MVAFRLRMIEDCLVDWIEDCSMDCIEDCSMV